jgi:hypothetical protein
MKTLEFASKRRKPHLHLSAHSKDNPVSELEQWMQQFAVMRVQRWPEDQTLFAFNRQWVIVPGS